MTKNAAPGVQGLNIFMSQIHEQLGIDSMTNSRKWCNEYMCYFRKCLHTFRGRKAYIQKTGKLIE